MKKKMKLKKVVVMLLSAFMMLSTFVACNANIEDAIMEPATVNFAPAMYKALNQDGTAQEVTGEDVGNYHWKYYYSKSPITTITNIGNDTEPSDNVVTGFADFFNENGEVLPVGLGKIQGLIKGESYYFALRGYSTATDTGESSEPLLMWEGKTDKATKITSKNTMVTISVTPKGKGDLFFNITAPAYDAESYAEHEENSPDIFRYTIAKIEDSAMPEGFYSDANAKQDLAYFDGLPSSQGYFRTVYSSDSNMVSYVSSSTDADYSLTAGTYMFNIQQMRYDDKISRYVDVENRGQFLLFTIEPGVDTVIRGSLDSSTIEYIKDYTGLNVIEFLKGDASKIKSLDVQVKNSEGNTKMIGPDNRINVADKDYVRFTSISDGYKLYWNTYSITSPTSGYTVTTSPTDQRYVVNVNGTSKTWNTNIETSGTDIIAYGEADKSYIITIEKGDYSVSFTIVGLGDEDAVTAVSPKKSLADFKAMPNSDNSSLELGATSATVTAEVPVNTTITDFVDKLFEKLLGGEKKVALSVGVLEKDRTPSTLSLEISLKAIAEVYKNDVMIDSNSGTIKGNVGNYVTVTVQVDKDLENVSVYHKDTLMTSTTDVTTYTEGGGAYHYDALTGKLTIKTKSFSPFTLNFTKQTFVAQIGLQQFATLQAAIDAARDGETIKLLKNVNVVSQLTVDKELTLDLNGMTISYTGAIDTLKSGVIGVKRGGNLTIDDSSSSGVGKIDSGNAYAAVSMTIKGESTATNAEYAILTVNAGTLEGKYYAIVGNGTRHNTKITINGGTLLGTKENDSAGIYHPQSGELVINGGKIQGATGIYMKAGSATISTAGGEIKAIGTKGTYQTKGDGFESTGDALVLDNCDYPGGEPHASITGGTFTSKNGEAVGSYAKDGNNPITGFIKGGTFSSNLTAYVVASGYKVEESGNVWVVTAK